MIDANKVIEGLNACARTDGKYCGACPYTDEGDCVAVMSRDVLELLKEQKTKTHGGDSGMCEICSFYERAMPVKPHYNARTNWYECGACHYSMTSGMHCRGELIPAYKVGFCAKCGKAMQWE